MNRFWKLALCGVALSGASTVAIAQLGPVVLHQRMPPPMDAEKRAAAELRDIAVVLDLSQAQRTALEAWLKTWPKPSEGCRGPGGEPGSGDAGEGAETADQRFERMSACLTMASEVRLASINAARRFYAQLDDRQKQRFDALERLRHGDMPMPPGGPRGMPAPPPMD